MMMRRSRSHEGSTRPCGCAYRPSEECQYPRSARFQSLAAWSVLEDVEGLARDGITQDTSRSANGDRARTVPRAAGADGSAAGRPIASRACHSSLHPIDKLHGLHTAGKNIADLVREFAGVIAVLVHHGRLSITDRTAARKAR